MSFRRILIRTLVLTAFLIISLVAIWRTFRLDEKLRLSLLDYLRPYTGSSLVINDISIRPSTITINKVKLEISPQVQLTIPVIKVRHSPLKLIFGGIEAPGTVKSIKIVRPILDLFTSTKAVIDSTNELQSTENDLLSTVSNRICVQSESTWKYEPFAIKYLKDIRFIRIINILNGQIRVGSDKDIAGDSISVRIDIKPSDNIWLRGDGTIPAGQLKFSKARMHINGYADLTNGRFFLECDAENDEWGIENAELDSSQSILEFLSGRIHAHIGLRGAEEIKLSGRLNIENLALNYKSGLTLQLRDGNIRGNLTGTAFNMKGRAMLNGVVLPIKGTVQNLLNPTWQIEIHQPNLDISSLYIPDSINAIPLSGVADLSFDIHGEGSLYESELKLHSNKLSINTVPMKNMRICINIDNEIAQVDMFHATMLGGDLQIGGCLNLIKNNKDSSSLDHEYRINYNYVRKWSLDKSSDWAAIRSPSLEVMGELVNTLGKWTGYGEAILFDQIDDRSAPIREPILIGTFEMKNRCIKAAVQPPNRDGNLELVLQLDQINRSIQSQGDSIKPNNKIKLASKPVFYFTGKNTCSVLKEVVSSKYLPNKMDRYNINIDASGNMFLTNVNIEQQVDCKITWKSKQILNEKGKKQSGSIQGQLFREDKNSYIWDGDLKLSFPDNRILKGPFDFTFADGNLIFDNWVLRNEVDSTVLFARGEIPILNKKLGDPLWKDSTEIILNNFPLLDILRFYHSNLTSKLEANLGAWIISKNDSISFSCFTDIHSSLAQEKKENFPLNYTFAVTGNWVDNRLFIKHAALTKGSETVEGGEIYSIKGKERVVNLTGHIDFSKTEIDSLIIEIDGLSIDEFFEAITPNEEPRWGGNIDAHVELNGILYRPRVFLDAHLSSGMLHGVSGYWSNLQVITLDSLYRIERFDFGQEVTGLVNATGHYNRFNDEYQVELMGNNVEVKSLVRAFAGVSSPISGNSQLYIKIHGNKSFQEVVTDIQIEPGILGPLSFNRLNSQFHSRHPEASGSNLAGIEGHNLNNSSLNIDSITIDWGDSYGRFSGVIPLVVEMPLSFSGEIEGRLTSWLNRLESSLTKPKGYGKIEFSVGGTLNKPYVTSGNFTLKDGGIDLEDVVSEIRSLNAHIDLDSSGRIDIVRLDGKVDGKPFRFSNRFIEEPAAAVDSTKSVDSEETIKIDRYDLGIIQFTTGGDGIWAVIPGLMKKNWGGFMIFSGKNGKDAYEFRGPASRPIGVGRIGIRNATITYPFLTESGKKTSPFVQNILNLLERMKWDSYVVPERGCRYVNEISGLKDVPILSNFSSPFIDFDVKLYLDLQLDEELDGLYFTDSLLDTLRISGDLISTRGSIEYLDMDFQVQDLGIVFNPAELNPILYGSATTTIIDSSDIQREVRVVIYNNSENGSGDHAISHQIVSSTKSPVKGGRWGEISVIFEDDQGHSQEQILAMMGYAPDQITEKLTGLGGTLIENAMPIRRWTRFIERSLERWLGVDRFDIDPQVTRNIIEQQLYPDTDSTTIQTGGNPYLMILDQSRVTVGKYLTRDLYFSYTGLIQHGADAYNVTRLGMLHNWDGVLRLRRIAPNLNLNYRYQYDSLAELDDHSFRIRYSFYFD